MAAFLPAFLVGVLCIVLGICHRKGNISLLHSYHRNNIAEEDRLPFGKEVGLGIILCGAGICLQSILATATLLTEIKLFLTLGNVLLTLLLAAGLFITFRAIKKYNGSIF